MDSADSLARDIEILNVGRHAVGTDVKTAVLIVERRVNKYRLLADIDSVLCEHTHHSRDSLLDGSLAVLELDHRSVKPYADTVVGVNALVSVRALADYRSRRDVSCLKRMHERLAVTVDQLCADGTHLLGDKRAEYLLGISCTGRMILKGIRIEQLCSDTVAEDKSVSRCAVVIGGREALIVKPSRTAGSDNNGLCTGDKEFLCLHVHKDSTRGSAVFVKDKLNCRREINDRNSAVENLVAEGAHDLGAGIVLCRVHSLS